MTELEKKSLIVKINQSDSLFRGDLLKKTTSKIQSSSASKIFLILLTIFFILCLAVALYFGLNTVKLQYVVHDRYDGVGRCGTVEFVDYDAITSYTADDVTTMTDGRAGITAVKINTTTIDLPSTTCLIRYDHEWGIYHPNTLPKFSDLDLLMTGLTENGDVPVDFDDTTWTIDVFSFVDYKTLPSSVQNLCGDATLFKMIPKEANGNTDGDGDDGEDYDPESEIDSEEKRILSSSQVEKRIKNEKKRSINQKKKRQVKKIIAPLNEKVKKTSSVKKPNNLSGDTWCCRWCTTTRLQCSRICAPIQQTKYPYFSTNCKFVECNVILPCSWWRSQAAHN